MNDLIYRSNYQNLHMDRANPESMKTINVTINTDLSSSSTPRLLYQYEHGYNYTPQFWGLWDITYSSRSAGGSTLGGGTRRGYGYILHNTGAGMTATFYYVVDSVYVKLYFLYSLGGGFTPPPTGGTTARFTGYCFANDRVDQDYTV